MIATEANHCQIVKESLTGERAMDGQTYASVEILVERLERLKKLDKIFSGVTFSSAVRELAEENSAAVLG